MSTAAAASSTRVIAWNNLGMHCTDDDFSVFSLLPPYNTVVAQVIQNGNLVTNAAGLTVTYQAIADATGSMNTTSAGKSDFWTFVNDLYGAPLSVDDGLAGNAMPGAMNDPQPMVFNGGQNAFIGEGIPILPYDDTGKKNYYPMMRIVVRDGGGSTLATTDVVLPVSDEMSCIACHGSSAGDAAKPQSGWVNDADPLRDYRLNILRLHDEQHAFDPTYATALQTAGYNASGLYANVTVNQKPILCAACHASNALPGTGISGVSALTSALHSLHASVTDLSNGMTLDAAQNRGACYVCHPGSATRCLRGAMGSAVAANGDLEMQCQSCHSNMTAVGDPSRVGWLEEPACQQCHTGTATNNSGKIRFTSVFDNLGAPHVAADPIFATNADTPSAGFSLYQFSTGHGGLLCESCHGSTHAIYPSIHPNDNVQNLQFQGHKGTISECSSCHDQVPKTANGGPHGMHPIGQSWVKDHQEYAEGEGGDDDLVAAASSSQCKECHGGNLKGTVLSRALGDRTLQSEFGKIDLWRGFQVGCYACHNGPSSEGSSKNKAPKVKDLTSQTTNDAPVAIKLKGSDSDGDSLDYRVVEQPEHGTVGLSGKVATYYPEEGYAGDIAFTYAAWDGKIDSNLGHVTVGVEDASCPSTISEDRIRFDATGGAGDVELTIPVDCAWGITFDGPTAGFVGLTTPDSGTGPTTISVAVAANPGLSRSVGLLVGGERVLIQQGGTDSADLTIDVLNAKVKCGASCKIQGKIRALNGGLSKSGKTVARLYLSDDDVVDGADLVLGDVKVGKLKASANDKVGFSFKVPSSTPVDGRRVLVVIDPDADVLESDDANNEAASDPLSL